MVCLRILSQLQSTEWSKWSCATVCNLPMNHARSLSSFGNNKEETQQRLRKTASALSISMWNFAACFTSMTQEIRVNVTPTYRAVMHLWSVYSTSMGVCLGSGHDLHVTSSSWPYSLACSRRPAGSEIYMLLWKSTAM